MAAPTAAQTQLRLLVYPNLPHLQADPQLKSAQFNCLALDFEEPERLHMTLAARGLC